MRMYKKKKKTHKNLEKKNKDFLAWLSNKNYIDLKIKGNIFLKRQEETGINFLI